jgi:hypothetical protein
MGLAPYPSYLSFEVICFHLVKHIFLFQWTIFVPLGFLTFYYIVTYLGAKMMTLKYEPQIESIKQGSKRGRKNIVRFSSSHKQPQKVTPSQANAMNISANY